MIEGCQQVLPYQACAINACAHKYKEIVQFKNENILKVYKIQKHKNIEVFYTLKMQTY